MTSPIFQGVTDWISRLSQIAGLVDKLPTNNHAQLFLLLNLLVKVGKKANLTRMGNNNLGTIFGPIVGAIILTPLGEGLTGIMQSLGLNAPGVKAIFYGLTLMVIISFQPNGVWPWLARHLRLDRPRK